MNERRLLCRLTRCVDECTECRWWDLKLLKKVKVWVNVLVNEPWAVYSVMSPSRGHRSLWQAAVDRWRSPLEDRRGKRAKAQILASGSRWSAVNHRFTSRYVTSPSRLALHSSIRALKTYLTKQYVRLADSIPGPWKDSWKASLDSWEVWGLKSSTGVQGWISGRRPGNQKLNNLCWL